MDPVFDDACAFARCNPRIEILAAVLTFINPGLKRSALMTGDIRVSGLTHLEVRELQKELGVAAVKPFPEVTSKFREPVTLIMATVAVSSAALTAITVIATRPHTSTKRTITVESDSGSYTYSEESKTSGPPQAKEIEAIAKALKIDTKYIGVSGTSSST